MADTGTATILFTDLVGSTRLRSELGDTAADELRRTHDALLRTAVARHDGSIVKGLGDGLMVTFGSAADGVAAAVAIQQAMWAHNRRSADVALSVRVGLSAGDVLWEDGDCYGRPVIEASRLCAIAEGGQVLVSEVVRLLAGLAEGQSSRTLGALTLRGLDLPVQASELVWEPADVPVDVAGRPPVPPALAASPTLGLSGRQVELGLALDWWKTAAAGSPTAVLLSGEPGIGKTRMAREIGLRAYSEGATLLYGRCEEELGAPYQPFVEALEHMVGSCTAEHLHRWLGQLPGELARLCPWIGTVLPDLPEPVQADAETERYRLFCSVASWLTAASSPHGLVLVLDDLHWASRPTLVLLQHVLQAAGPANMLVLGTYRDTDLERTSPLTSLLADLRRTPGVHRVALSGLDRGGVGELLRDASGHDLDEPGRALAEALHAETDGNPFFLGEILRHLRESGAIYREGTRWVADRPVAELGIPEGVRDVVGRRLDRLPAAANEALSMAAVVGREFELDTLTSAFDLDPDAAVGALDAARTARLVEEKGVGRYVFSHALVRSTLYDELSATRRARMHARVARDLELRRPNELAALAHHFAAASVAGDLDKAIDYSRRAGDEAMAQLAHEHAVAYYRQALDLLGDDPHADDDRRCVLLISLGDAQRRSGDCAYRTTLLDAAELARRSGSTDLLVRAALLNGRGFWSMAGDVDNERIAVLRAALEAVGPDDTWQRARLLARLAGELMFSNDRSTRESLCAEAVDVARRLGDPVALADVLAEAAPASYTPWAIDRAHAYVEELLALSTSFDDPHRLAIAHLWSVTTSFFTAGPAAPRRESAARATALAHELGQPTLRWLAAAFGAMQVQVDEGPVQAQVASEAALELGRLAGQPDAWTWYAGQLGTVFRELGQVAEVLPLVEQEIAASPGLPAWEVVRASLLSQLGRREEALAIVRRLVTEQGVALPEDVLWLFGVALLLETAAELDDPISAQALYQQLLPFAALAIHGGVSYYGSAELYLGLGARTMGRLDDAIRHLEAARRVHEHMGAPLYLGLTCVELARVLGMRAQPGDAERARQERVTALELAEQTHSGLISRRLAQL